MRPSADHNGANEPADRSGTDRAPTVAHTATETAVIDALVERKGEGMTVFELRTWVDADIDELEATLAELDRAGRIDVDASGDRTRIHPTDAALEQRGDGTDRSLLDRVREWVTP